MKDKKLFLFIQLTLVALILSYIIPSSSFAPDNSASHKQSLNNLRRKSMSLNPKLYPPRSRYTNIKLIKDIVYAKTQMAQNEAIKVFSTSLHPSLFSELDWMEMTMPIRGPQKKKYIRNLVDSLFLDNLEKIILLRQSDFNLNGSILLAEVSNNIDFYKFVFENAPDTFNVLGRNLQERLESVYNTSRRGDRFDNLTLSKDESNRIERLFDQIKDRQKLPPLISVEIWNAIAIELDHITSRMRAKSFLRSTNGKLPTFIMAEPLSSVNFDELKKNVRSTYEQAQKFSLDQLKIVTKSILDYLKITDLNMLNQFEGERAAGYGPCPNCAMMYASSAIISIDPTCPYVFEKDANRIYLPLDINISQCPFCGNKTRSDTAAMFYSPRRNTIIYCVPTLGQFTKEEAVEVHRPTIEAIRKRYKGKISVDQALKFDQALEVMTYSVVQFLVTIQMGTSARQWHAFNIVQLAGGISLLADPTTGVTIELLTPSEVQRLWNIEHNDSLGQANVILTTAISAYAKGDYERSRDILVDLNNQYPNNNMIRSNLAAVHLALGDKGAAKKTIENEE